MQGSVCDKIITGNVVNSELNAVKTESAILTVICKYNFKNLIRKIACFGPFFGNLCHFVAEQ